MHEKAEKYEWRIRSKSVSCDYRWLLHGKIKIASLDEAFSELFELEASPVEGQALQQKG